MNLTNFFNKKNLSKYNRVLLKINELKRNKYSKLSKNDILIEIEKLKAGNSKKHDKVIHAIAIANRAAELMLGMTYYDVQIIGALSLIDGCMAEMKTGEGKTLTCSAAVAANYVLGYKTHVATANDYLAQRDQQLMEPIYSCLGIKSSNNTSFMDRSEKEISYKSDVLYSTAQELGFDFLRDNLVSDISQKIQPKLNNVKAIIDEADFILIDEARTPLIISGESPIKNLDTYFKIRDLSMLLKEMPEIPEEKYMDTPKYIPGDYWVDEKYKTVHLSEEGFEKLETLLHKENLIEGGSDSSLYHHSNGWLVHEVLNALKAEYCYIKEKDYVIIDGEIVIVDQNTGRLSDGRTWSNGLHQAIEAKENIEINPETMTMGSISIQNYFRNYNNIAGMSGTIMTSSTEFYEIYNTATIRIPTNRKMIRVDHNDKIFITLKAKYSDMISLIKEKHSKGQPILIGTTSVKESEDISQLLRDNLISHNVLNAKNHHREAQIISQAGKPFSVTVSTSMAGRGTDIMLGGNKTEMVNLLKGYAEQLNERIGYFQFIENQMNSQGVIPSGNEKYDFQTPDLNELAAAINGLYVQQNIIDLLNMGLENCYNYIDLLKNITENEIKNIEENHELWRNQVLEIGGLCVIGSSRNESRRIDDQLRGRAGRQGDPGESLYYLSLEDSWVSHLGRNPVFQHLIKSLPAEEAIESNMITKAIYKAQSSIEGLHYSSRKSTFQYDSVTDEGRRKYLEFRDLLISDSSTLKTFISNTIMEELSVLGCDGLYEFLNDEQELNLELLISTVLKQGLTRAIQTAHEFKDSPYFTRANRLQKYSEVIEDFIATEIGTIPDDEWSKISNKSIDILDKKWAEHLLFSEDARQNVAFSGMAQKNPLQEFKKLCFESFDRTFKEFAFDVIEVIAEQKNTEEKQIDLETN